MAQFKNAPRFPSPRCRRNGYTLPSHVPRRLNAGDRDQVTLNMRADRDVAEAFKATGEGWQTRINDVLRAYARSHRLLPRD